jgi:hypothetical protein
MTKSKKKIANIQNKFSMVRFNISCIVVVPIFANVVVVLHFPLEYLSMS